MTRDETIRRLRAEAETLRAQGVMRLSLFGSTARDEAQADSDVDLLVDVAEPQRFSLFDLVGVEQHLTDVLGRPAHVLVDEPQLRPDLRRRIAEDAVEIYPACEGIGTTLPQPDDQAIESRRRLAKTRMGDRLAHMAAAASAVADYLAGKTSADYAGSRQLRSAVEREVERLSEASRHLPEAMTTRFPDIDWRRLADIGNRLRHGYDRVDDDRIWAIATEDVPILATVIARLRADLDEPQAE